MVQPGTLLEGKYEILDKIREGGMGSIYRVRHRLLDEIRVVKVMKPSVVADADLRRRFVEEARTATRLKHPNICTIYDFAIDDTGMAYLVMEFIDGLSIADLLRTHGRPSLPLGLEISHQSLLALGFLHRKGIVHRDVAPDNIMLSHDEQGAPLIKLIDLGIAKVAEGPVEATATGIFLGKLKYASPEQYGSLPKGHRLDGRSDLYGLGIVMYEMLTGVLPFEGDTAVELLRAHVFTPPRPFEESDSEGRVPPELRAAVLRALQKRREDRFASAEDFDREIVAIRSRFVKPEDLEGTKVMLAGLRPSGGVRIGSATPSAQGHIDRQFAAGTTPTPVRETLGSAPTEVAPASGPAIERVSNGQDKIPTQPYPPGPVPARRIPTWLLATAAAAIALVVAYLLTSRHRPAPDTVAAREPVESPIAAPTAAPIPTAVPSPPPTLAPAPSPVPTVPVSSSAAAVPVPAVPATAAARREQPRREPTARPARVERPASSAAPKPPSVAVAAVIPTLIATAAVPEPPRPSPPSAEVPRPAPAPSPRPAPTDSDRIREAVQTYETAQNTLNAELYARVFPHADRSRIEQAFSNFRTQSVDFQIRRIDVKPGGTSAEVFGFESRTAVPRVGNDVHVNAERVLEMEKHGDGWVIVAIR